MRGSSVLSSTVSPLLRPRGASIQEETAMQAIESLEKEYEDSGRQIVRLGGYEGHHVIFQPTEILEEHETEHGTAWAVLAKVTDLDDPDLDVEEGIVYPRYVRDLLSKHLEKALLVKVVRGEQGKKPFFINDASSDQGALDKIAARGL